MYIVDNIINIVAMFVIDTSAKTLTITLAQSAVVKVRFNIDEIYSSTGASHVINLPIKDGMIATGAYVAIIDGVETLLPYSYPTEEPDIVWDENGLLSTMAVGDNTAYLGTIVSQSIVCTPPAPLVEKTGTSSVSYDPNIYSGTWSVRRTLELYYDQGNGLTTKKSIDVTDYHIVYNTNVQALYDAVSVFIQNYIDGCSLCKDSSVFMKLNGYMELFNGYWLNGSYEKAYDALYEAGKLVNLSSATVEIEPMMNGIAVHIQNFNNPHKTSFSNIEGYPSTPTNNRFLRDDKTFAEIALRHSQLILPNEDLNVQHLTDAEKSELHTHTNKSVLDTITSVLVSGWNAAATWVSTYGANVLTHISDGSLHVTQALLNTISNKVDKVEGKGLSTNDFTNEQKELLSQQSGTNTGDQDLSGLEPKRGADDFYITNAEKTQGALATGNTVLPTVKSVADYVASILPKPPEEQDLYSYGVVIDTRIASPTLQRIGSADLGKVQPIVNNFKACILKDDATINYYLDNNDVTKKALDGLPANLDGTDGQVMIEIPDMWRKITELDSYRTEIRFSPYEIVGFEKIEGFYYSPILATVQRSTNKLSSVISTSTNYRGGDNNSSWDALPKTLLGMCATALSRTQFRNYAQNRGIKYIGSTYYMNEVLLQLYWCEYANLNMQDAYIASLTADGYRQGGLGPGVTTINGTNWNTFNNAYPLIPNGVGLQAVGVNTGIKNYTISGLSVSVDIPVWHGIENIFGHMWQSEDGVNIEIQAADSGALSKAWISKKIRFFADTITSEYACVGNIPRVEGWITQMIKGTILPLAVGGSSNTYYCDYSYTTINTTGVSIRQVLRGGAASTGSGAGLGCSISANAPSFAYAYIASRLCAVKTL